jgi:hypothetical protein
VQRADTIANMTTAELNRTIREAIERLLPTHLPSLTVDDLVVVGSLTVEGTVSYPQNTTFTLIGASGQPGFQNGWGNSGGVDTPCGFLKTEAGYVNLQGAIQSGTVGSAAFVLPPGYRPGSTVAFSISSNGAAGIVTIDSGGNVTPVSPSSNVLVRLDGIQFKTA